MPPLSRAFLKTGMVFFGLSLLLLLWISASDLYPALEIEGYWMPVFWHLLMVGWITQIIMGVSYWMFPKISRDNHYGPRWLGWTCYGMLNVGLILRATSEPWVGSTGTVKTAGMASSALLQWLAGLIYIGLIWIRIRGRRRRRKSKSNN